MTVDCSACLALFALDRIPTPEQIERAFPDCACEACSVGVGSPDRVADDEALYRLFIDPTEVDEATQDLARNAFKWAHINGLSVFRERATNAEIEALVTDALSFRPGRPIKTVRAAMRVTCRTLREMREARLQPAQRRFCIYDQTVPRVVDSSLTPIPTHASVFFRRSLIPGVAKRQLQRDCEADLYDVFTVQRVDLATFRNGLVEMMNARALKGEFLLARL